jgi:putative nucleotidyltransferase with HDIG domain
MYNRRQAQDAFLRYAEQYDTENILIRHKVEHTLRVAELSLRYAKAIGMDEADAGLAWFIGLLHDIGRFEQARRYGTFVDSKSVDHAELSGDILFRDRLIESFPEDSLPEDWPAVTEAAVRWHNKLSLPDALDSRTRRFAELLRDADKTDIFRVIAGIPFRDRIGSSKGVFAETGEASPEVMACVLEHRCVPSGFRRTVFDGHIAHCCMAFELVFEVSRRTVKEEGWLRSLLAETGAEGNEIRTDREKEQLRILRREIENAWQVSL